MTSPGATWHIDVVAETGSTNADLVAAAGRGAADRTVLRALHQTAGKGRLDREWDAPPGANLLVSILFRDVPTHPHQLTQRVAIAALQACESLAAVSPTLKWPNDVLLDGRKLAGVLAQAGPTFVVVGIGLNVGWAPDDAAKLGEQYDPGEVLEATLGAYDRLPSDITASYRQCLATLGRSVRVELTESAVVGTALDVLADGRLVVLDDCGITHRIDTGDVVHLR